MAIARIENIKYTTCLTYETYLTSSRVPLKMIWLLCTHSLAYSALSFNIRVVLLCF